MLKVYKLHLINVKIKLVFWEIKNEIKKLINIFNYFNSID